MKADRILAIVPCYNEADSIRTVLADLQAVGIAVVVIDDGSRDGTAAVASALAPTVRHITNLGIGCSVQTGLKYAQRHGFTLCVQIDGDGQHRADQIAILQRKMKESGANIVVGSRPLSKTGTYRSSFPRRLGSLIISRWLKLLFGITIHDPTSGMRLLDRKAIEFFHDNYPPDFPEPLSLAAAALNGLTIREAGVVMVERKFGHSSISGLTPLAYMARCLVYLLLMHIRGEATWSASLG